MTHTMNTELIVDRYLAACSEPDAAICCGAIAGLWAADGVEFVEAAAFRGLAQRAALQPRVPSGA